MPSLFIVFSVMIGLLMSSSAQSPRPSISSLYFEVHPTYPTISHPRQKILEANTLEDLNPYYKPDWIREYKSVELSGVRNGIVEKAIAKKNILTDAQKALLRNADPGTGISVIVYYLPENDLNSNKVHEFPFRIYMNPDNQAEFPGGKPALNNYLYEKAISKITSDDYVGYDLSAIKFAIDEEGNVLDAHIFRPIENDKTDDLLLETICTMPKWEPAFFLGGKRVKQEFVLTVGNMENCNVNLLNIRKTPPALND